MDNQNLVWMDLEMTGLDPERDVIIEVAVIVTDQNLNIVAEGPDVAVYQPAALFDGMDQWCREHHTASGLWAKVQASTLSLEQAETMVLDFIRPYVGERESPLCGNSIWQDRRFIVRYMPKLDRYLHYRMIDVSTIKELVRHWYPERCKYGEKKNEHRSLADIRESINELKHYRSVVFRDVGTVE